MSDWPIVRLGDYCSKIGSGATPRGGASVYLDEGEICLIRSQNIYNDGFKENGLVYITKESAVKLKNVIVERNDVLLNITGDSVARVCLVDENYLPARVNQHVAIIRPDPNEFDPRYVRYLLTSPAMQNLLLTIAAVGATRNALTKNMIETLEVSKPPLQVQVDIADKLESLDNKIELNRQTNHTLEQIAQAIFKSWFVDFDPVKAKIEAKQNGQNPELAAMCAISGKTEEQLKSLNEAALQQLKTTAALFPYALVESELGEIPKGWSVSCIDDVCDFQNGYAFKSKEMTKNPENTYKVFKMGGIKKGGGLNKSKTKDYYDKSKCENLDRYLIKKGDLLMCMTDMKNNVALLGHTALMDVDDEYILNQRVGLLRTKDKVIANYPFLYILTNSGTFIEDLRSRANSGVQVNLSTSEIKSTNFVLPSESVHLAFDKLTERLQEQIFSLEAEQNYLSEIRDALIPKLLSGEITLNENPGATEAVA